MSKKIPDAILDDMLQVIHDAATNIHVTEGEPANYADISGKELAGQVMVGSPAYGAGSPDGRQATVAQQADVNISASGNADHVSLSNGVDTLLLTTTCTPQALTSGGTVTIPQWVHTLRAPA